MYQMRMISRKIYRSNEFLDLPGTTQLLYTHLVVNANDDGVVRNVRCRMLLTMLPCTGIDFKLLIQAGFITPYKNGVYVITEWNQLKKVQESRHNQTVYVDELNCLSSDTSKNI